MQEMNLDCVIMAPATIRTAAIDRVKKTDRRDARGVAQALANNAYKPVHVPTETDLEIRNYIRLREDVQDGIKRTKQQILSFVLKHGCKFDGKSYWTIKHREWLKNLEISRRDRETLDEYLDLLSDLEARVERYDAKIEEMSRMPEYDEAAGNQPVSRELHAKSLCEFSLRQEISTALKQQVSSLRLLV